MPGLFDAELKLPKRLLSLGAGAAGRGRGTAEVAAGLPLRPALEGILGGCADLLTSLGFDVTTIFFGAGCVLISLSRALLEPAISDEESPLTADSSLPVLVEYQGHQMSLFPPSTKEEGSPEMREPSYLELTERVPVEMLSRFKTWCFPPPRITANSIESMWRHLSQVRAITWAHPMAVPQVTFG